MRQFMFALCIVSALMLGSVCSAKSAKTAPGADGTSSDGGSSNNGHIEVTADKSLEWYQDQRLYVARGNAKAIRGDMTVTADLLTAHEREQAGKGNAAKTAIAPDAASATTSGTETTVTAKTAKQPANENGTGDIDKMTAEGNVHIITSKSEAFGQHGVYDLGQHVAYLTGDGLKYKTDKETVTAKDSLEYWEEKKIAVARGKAVAIGEDRHVEGDVLTAEFRDLPNGKSELHTLTADGNVTVITAGNDVTRGNRAVYDINRNIAVVSGNVRITRVDGTQLTGDVAEVDFAANQSRLMNEGHGRVRALLTSKTQPSKTPKQQTAATP